MSPRAAKSAPDAPTTRQTEEIMRMAMHVLEVGFPKGTGIALVVFDRAGPHGSRANYIGNCPREDMLAAFKEIVARWDATAKPQGSA